MTDSTNESMSTQSECSICLLHYTEETKKATECQHIFHQECIGRWLLENNSCPLCRTILLQQQQQYLPSVNGTPTFGSTASVTLNRFGDLISTPFVITLPSIWEEHQSSGSTGITRASPFRLNVTYLDEDERRINASHDR